VPYVGGRKTTSLRTKLLGQITAIENLRASAIFEDRDIQGRSDTPLLVSTWPRRVSLRQFDHSCGDLG